MQSSFSYTNKAAGTAVTPVAVGAKSNYAVTSKSNATASVLSNTTCSIDQGEMVSYRCREVDSIPTSQRLAYPSPISGGIEFGLKHEAILRTTDDDGTILFDEPIVITTTFKVPKSSTVTEEVLTEEYLRHIGFLRNETDETFRWNELMRSALVPSED